MLPQGDSDGQDHLLMASGALACFSEVLVCRQVLAGGRETVQYLALLHLGIVRTGPTANSWENDPEIHAEKGR